MLGLRLQQANKIALRRHKQRLNEDYWYYEWHFKRNPRVTYIGSKETNFGVLRKTPCRCSCWMCRNLRKNEGKTIQEIRQEYVE